MDYMEHGKRAEDKGQDSPLVILARIDERTRNTDDKIDRHISKFEDHAKENSKDFGNLNRWMWMCMGALVLMKLIFGK